MGCDIDQHTTCNYKPVECNGFKHYTYQCSCHEGKFECFVMACDEPDPEVISNCEQCTDIMSSGMQKRNETCEVAFSGKGKRKKNVERRKCKNWNKHKRKKKK